MDDYETIRVLEGNLNRLLGWISAADFRFSTVLAIDTAMFSVLAAVARSPSEWTIPAAISSSIAALLIAASLFFLALSSFPRTIGPKGSLIFFGGIAALEADQYHRLVREVTAEKYIKDLAAQCHRNAEIADKKFKWIKRAMGALLLSLTPWVISLYLLYAARPRKS